MIEKQKISIIIPISGTRHLSNLEFMIRNLRNQTMTDYEVIISKSTREVFNRNWSMNVGARNSSGDKLLFIDADIYFGNDYLEKVINFNKPWFVAWSKIVYFTKESSDNVINGIETFPDSDMCMFSDPEGASGGSVCIDRSFFFDVLGCHNENYEGWGAEDNDGAARAMAILGKFERLNYVIGHIHHEDDRRDNIYKRPIDKNLYNLEITKRHPNEITKRLKLANTGNLSGPTKIKIEDL